MYGIFPGIVSNRKQVSCFQMANDNLSLLLSLLPYPHFLIDVISYLDLRTVKNVRLVCGLLNDVVKSSLKTKKLKRALRRKVFDKWLSDKEMVPTIFKCDDDVSDIEFLREGSNMGLVGLYNGDIELWDFAQQERKLRLRDQQGMVQVGGQSPTAETAHIIKVRCNDDFIVGISDDSTVMVWRLSGELVAEYFHHRASVYGLVVTEQYAVTGAMDGIMSLIDMKTRTVEKIWSAEDPQWGVSDLAGRNDTVVSSSFSGRLKVWSG